MDTNLGYDQNSVKRMVTMFDESEWGPRTTVTQLIFTCSKSTIETLENEIRSKLTIKTPEPHRRSGVFIVNFEHILNLFVVHFYCQL